jgi:hypothetical protein
MTEFCCKTAEKSMFLRHSKKCRVWKRHERGELKIDGDHGQGDGCEGGKCEVSR